MLASLGLLILATIFLLGAAVVRRNPRVPPVIHWGMYLGLIFFLWAAAGPFLIVPQIGKLIACPPGDTLTADLHPDRSEDPLTVYCTSPDGTTEEADPLKIGIYTVATFLPAGLFMLLNSVVSKRTS